MTTLLEVWANFDVEDMLQGIWLKEYFKNFLLSAEIWKCLANIWYHAALISLIPTLRHVLFEMEL